MFNVFFLLTKRFWTFQAINRYSSSLLVYNVFEEYEGNALFNPLNRYQWVSTTKGNILIPKASQNWFLSMNLVTCHVICLQKIIGKNHISC